MPPQGFDIYIGNQINFIKNVGAPRPGSIQKDVKIEKVKKKERKI